MKVAMVTGPGKADVVDADRPQIGPHDVLVRMRACGICGSDAFYIAIGGIPPRQGQMPLGHEPAGEIVEVGTDVSGLAVGDHVVINPMAAASGIIGNGGATGALADYLLIENAVRGTSLEVIPDHVPWEVAALNEPMAVARHGVNRCKPKPSDKVVVFGAGPDRAGRDARLQVRWGKPRRGRGPGPVPAGEGTADRRRRRRSTPPTRTSSRA